MIDSLSSAGPTWTGGHAHLLPQLVQVQLLSSLFAVDVYKLASECLPAVHVYVQPVRRQRSIETELTLILKYSVVMCRDPHGGHLLAQMAQLVF